MSFETINIEILKDFEELLNQDNSNEDHEKYLTY